MAGLRACSYPLDWGQSGSLLLEDMLRLEPRETYYIHFHRPNISFCQDVDHLKKETIPLIRAQQVYGFPYFYNPHRPVSDSQAYHLRCLYRFKNAIKNPLLHKEFLYCDRLDNVGELYFPDQSKAIDLIYGLFIKYVVPPWRVTIARIDSAITTLPNVNHSYIKDGIRLTHIRYSSHLTPEGYHPFVISALYPSVFRQSIAIADDNGVVVNTDVSSLKTFRPHYLV